MFAVEVGHVTNHLMAVEQRIEETDEQILVHLRAEQLLEAEVGIGVDITFFDAEVYHDKGGDSYRLQGNGYKLQVTG